MSTDCTLLLPTPLEQDHGAPTAALWSVTVYELRGDVFLEGRRVRPTADMQAVASGITDPALRRSVLRQSSRDLLARAVRETLWQLGPETRVTAQQLHWGLAGPKAMKVERKVITKLGRPFARARGAARVHVRTWRQTVACEND